MQTMLHSNQKYEKSLPLICGNKASNYPSWKDLDYPICRDFVFSAKDLKGARVAALRRLSDYPIKVGSDYAIPWIFNASMKNRKRT